MGRAVEAAWWLAVRRHVVIARLWVVVIVGGYLLPVPPLVVVWSVLGAVIWLCSREAHRA